MFSDAISSICVCSRVSSWATPPNTAGSASANPCVKKPLERMSLRSFGWVLMGSILLRQFVDTGLVTTALERSGEKGFEARLRKVRPDQPGAHRDDVGVVVVARERGGERFGDQRAAARRVAIDRDRDADPRSAQRHAQRRFAARDRIGQLVAVIGIVDARVGLRTQVNHLVTQRGGVLDQQRLQRDGGVIGGEGNAQGEAASRL
ncbi:hypothetical protein WR25_22132 [Diploscapter pachys]|uniref:Uncharacterized protein n=1 Tax=Diploscapter pachys TaxID=2018661 RepID=A0A2A2KFH6_9BILA|nr:hypothetical protein WR25_22132 [Diploscapter pachys]